MRYLAQLVITGSAAQTVKNTGPRWFVAGDLDGFFGLFFSGFPDLLLIASLTPLCGLPQELVTRRILPAVFFGSSINSSRRTRLNGARVSRRCWKMERAVARSGVLLAVRVT